MMIMEKKINIAELLKDCPKGMELDCTMYENVTFDEVITVICFDDKERVKIILSTHYSDGTKDEINLTEFGTYTDDETAKCVIFPKGKTTWEGFVPPCKFKDRDIVAVTLKPEGTWVGIFKQYTDDFESYCSINTENEFRSMGLKNHSLKGVRLATEEEKQKLFNAIKENGYKWNAENKTLEKLIEPKFKVGDKIKSKISQCEYTVLDIRKNVYILHYAPDKFYNYHIPFCDEYKYDLIPDKFDINTLKPFDKVLVRQNVSGKWSIDFFGGYDEGFYYTTGSSMYVQCIPYEGNEHLLGTTEDCDNYYKNW